MLSSVNFHTPPLFTHLHRQASPSDTEGLSRTELDVLVGGPLDSKSMWTFETQGTASSPAFGLAGELYVGSADDHLYCLDTKTGKKKWAYKTEGSVGDPSVDPQGNIYFGSGEMEGKVRALAPDGSKRWAKKIGRWVQGEVAIDKDRVYAQSEDGTLFALSKETGEEAWTRKTDPFATTPIPDSDGGLVVIEQDGERHQALARLDAATGEELWSTPVGDRICNTPAVGGGKVFYANAGGRMGMSNGAPGEIRALDQITGQALWSFPTEKFAAATPLYDPVTNTVFVGAHDHRLYALNADTGEKRWDFKCPDIVWTQPSLDKNGTLYFGCCDDEGTVYAVDSKTGLAKWKHESGGSLATAGPAVDAEGTVYIGQHRGGVQAIHGDVLSRIEIAAREQDGVPEVTFGEDFVEVGGVVLDINS